MLYTVWERMECKIQVKKKKKVCCENINKLLTNEVHLFANIC